MHMGGGKTVGKPGFPGADDVHGKGGSDLLLWETHVNNKTNNTPPSHFMTGHDLEDCDAGSKGSPQLGKQDYGRVRRNF